ncbi:LacI family DNA-binding transcriptional regulator [Duganella callida]|uniref:LacI family DNA-binding transcriptional regulator n=1 Tax=Duganella callida TaxID=2561932 RepID=A0A4Y9S2R5_9BURK|nr:LacI family DNA-binding transcriptional regulator [Duganella callida]TFW14761.1 LacI family DNA-binding transcriptional regulator [Duganella callida]
MTVHRPPAAPSAVTLIDVAKAAGVSPITVSRALNEPQLVRPATLAKVQEAVKRTGYVKNMLAGGLASSRSKLVAMVLPTISTQTFADMVQGATDRLTAAGYQLLLGIVGYEMWREEILVETVLSRRPDGVILTGSLHTDSTRQRLQQLGIPVVETWDTTSHPIDMSIGFSHEEVGHACAAHLLERGYRRFGMLTANDPRAGQRTQGFQVTLAKQGVSVIASHQIQAPGALPQGRMGAVKLLDAHPELDCIFCSSDTLAHGVLIEAQSRGLRVPRDLAIMGFGDLNFSGCTEPPLSTVRVDGARIGAMSAQALLDRLNGSEEAPAERVINTGFELIQRGST